ncbi:MAG: hypothetical protein D3926_06470 [Desulfobacteraceae bacterium]|nr:MAG: hypothetical protein D3926_06470 [Desulfobacteraceae bacterium]
MNFSVPRSLLFRPVHIFAVMILCGMVCLNGCASLVSRATSDMMNNLSLAIINNNDLDMVKDGAPAYLLMIDSLIKSDPDNPELLSQAALLYTAYSDMFVKDRERAKKLADKAMTYSQAAACRVETQLCHARKIRFETFDEIISGMTEKQIPVFFTFGSAWAAWIKANSDDFNAIADIARIESIMLNIIRLDESYRDGAAFLYLGTLASLLPPALGGKPDQARDFFEKSMALAGDRNLMVKVTYARQYARMMFDKELHDRLLEDVLSADPDIEGYTLVNTLAQKQAQELLESGTDYF